MKLALFLFLLLVFLLIVSLYVSHLLQVNMLDRFEKDADKAEKDLEKRIRSLKASMAPSRPVEPSEEPTGGPGPSGGAERS